MVFLPSDAFRCQQCRGELQNKIHPPGQGLLTVMADLRRLSICYRQAAVSIFVSLQPGCPALSLHFPQRLPAYARIPAY